MVIFILLLALAFIYPMVDASREREAQRRVQAGLCGKCAYDRSGLPPTASCPECGTALER